MSSLSGSLQFDSRPLDYFSKTKPTKVSPRGVNLPYTEIKRFDSSDPPVELGSLQEQYKRLLNCSTAQVSAKHRSIPREILQVVGRTELSTLLQPS